MSAAQVDPHDKMRSRDVNKVARGEQAPRPVHVPGTVSSPPENKPKFSAKKEEEEAKNKDNMAEENRKRPSDDLFPTTNQMSHCYSRYLQYHKCLQRRGNDPNDCKNFADYIRLLCPYELIERWDEQRKLGTLPGSI